MQPDALTHTWSFVPEYSFAAANGLYFLVLLFFTLLHMPSSDLTTTNYGGKCCILAWKLSVN